jgi:serine/threonine protein kinase
MSMKTLLIIGMQCIDRLEYLHDLGFIHRDLKPANIAIGLGKKASTFYLIDFGLAKRYICPQTGQHVKHTANRGKFGTTKYMSKNAHSGFE